MKYSYRCSRCGRRTPSFEYEDHLKDYAIDWKITDMEHLCPKCASGENDEFLKKMQMWEMIWTAIAFIIIVILWVCETLTI